ncbi:MAG: POTRA domain-containing protein [Sulfurovum sp.]|nr:POTRA domain-containing protein [Sulfurovum sp.]
MFKNIVFTLVLLSSTPLWASLFGDDKKEVLMPKHIIKISGEAYFDKSQMFDALGVEYKSMFQFWKDDTATIKDKLLPTLHASLRAFYDSEGFYDATYTIKESNLTTLIKVKENKPVKVGDINISSDYDIASWVTFKKGDVFQAKKFIAIKSKIMGHLLKNGYCSYALDTKAYVDLKKHIVDIKYTLKKRWYMYFWCSDNNRE